MTVADRIRAIHSEDEGSAEAISNLTGISKGYINKILRKGYDAGDLNLKWMSRMRKSLLRGEIVGQSQFYEFTKSGDHADVGLNRGSGKTLRVKRDAVLSYWRSYYGIYR